MQPKLSKNKTLSLTKFLRPLTRPLFIIKTLGWQAQPTKYSWAGKPNTNNIKTPKYPPYSDNQFQYPVPNQRHTNRLSSIYQT